jgi:cytochrome d ubiquinol oxidase subunit II
MLIGIVSRGSAFVFRSHGSRSGAGGSVWGRTFAIASTITPVLLGVVIGAVSTGAVGAAQSKAGAAPFFDVFVAPWLATFPIAVGVLALTLFALLAATYLTVAARDAALREDFRRRALGSAGAAFVVAFGTLVLSRKAAPQMGAGLTAATWSLPLHLVTGTAAVVAIWALWRRRFGLARVAVGAQVSLILWGWAAALFPYLVPPALTIRDAAAPDATLEVLLWLLAAGALILIPSLGYLLRTFAPGAATRE